MPTGRYLEQRCALVQPSLHFPARVYFAKVNIDLVRYAHKGRVNVWNSGALKTAKKDVKMTITATICARINTTSAHCNVKNNCMSKLSPSIQRCAYSAILSSVVHVRLELQEAEKIGQKWWSKWKTVRNKRLSKLPRKISNRVNRCIALCSMNKI